MIQTKGPSEADLSALYLTTSGLQGVSVAAYNADEFPAFFTPHSGCRAPARVDTPQQAAQLIHSSRQLGLDNGILIGVLFDCLLSPQEDLSELQNLKANWSFKSSTSPHAFKQENASISYTSRDLLGRIEVTWLQAKNLAVRAICLEISIQTMEQRNSDLRCVLDSKGEDHIVLLVWL